MASNLGACCLLCGVVVDSVIRECPCGNVSVKSTNFAEDSLVIFVDDIKTIEIKKIYYDNSGRMAKLVGFPDLQFGKAFYLKKESK